MPDEEIQPLVIGPDGRLSESTPRTFRTTTPPRYFRGSGDPVSEFLANFTNAMITNLFFTPETIAERHPRLLDEPNEAYFERFADEIAARAAKAAEDAAREANAATPEGHDDRDHIVGACWCGWTHPDHVWSDAACWCGKKGIHAVGTPR